MGLLEKYLDNKILANKAKIVERQYQAAKLIHAKVADEKKAAQQMSDIAEAGQTVQTLHRINSYLNSMDDNIHHTYCDLDVAAIELKYNLNFEISDGYWLMLLYWIDKGLDSSKHMATLQDALNAELKRNERLSDDLDSLRDYISKSNLVKAERNRRLGFDQLKDALSTVSNHTLMTNTFGRDFMDKLLRMQSSGKNPPYYKDFPTDHMYANGGIDVNEVQLPTLRELISMRLDSLDWRLKPALKAHNAVSQGFIVRYQSTESIVREVGAACAPYVHSLLKLIGRDDNKEKQVSADVDLGVIGMGVVGKLAVLGKEITHHADAMDYALYNHLPAGRSQGKQHSIDLILSNEQFYDDMIEAARATLPNPYADRIKQLIAERQMQKSNKKRNRGYGRIKQIHEIIERLKGWQAQRVDKINQTVDLLVKQKQATTLMNKAVNITGKAANIISTDDLNDMANGR